MIAVTGATGQLGKLVIARLSKKVPAHQIVAVVRNAAKASSSVPRGVNVRQASYEDVAALKKAFGGVEKLLLISSSEVGKREAQHRNVIEAAGHAGVKFIAYTSLLKANTSPLSLASEHLATETSSGHPAFPSPFCAMAGITKTTLPLRQPP